MQLPSGSSLGLFKNWSKFEIPAIGGSVRSFHALSSYVAEHQKMHACFTNGPLVSLVR